jgi:hypothetical protein
VVAAVVFIRGVKVVVRAGELSVDGGDLWRGGQRRTRPFRVFLRREGTAARDRRPHRSVGAPAGPEGKGNDPAA